MLQQVSIKDVSCKEHIFQLLLFFESLETCDVFIIKTKKRDLVESLALNVDDEVEKLNEELPFPTELTELQKDVLELLDTADGQVCVNHDDLK